MWRSILLLGIALGVGPVSQVWAEDLLQLYRQALIGNPALKAQELAVDRAEARKDQARSRLLPQLSATASYARNNFHSDAINSDQYGSKRRVLQARQPLFDLSSFYGLRAEQARILQNREDLASVRMEVASELVDRYLEVLGAMDELAYLEGEKISVLGQRTRLRRLYERQMAKVTDLYEVEAYYATLEAQEIEARNARDVALEKLRETTGVAVKSVPPLARESFPAPPGSLQGWVDQGVRNNRRLLGLQHAIESEESGVAGAKAQHAPQLALVASKTWSDTDFDNRRNPPFDVTSVGVQLNLPILEGGRVNAAVRESEARRGIARQQYEEKYREVEREIRTAYLKTVADQARIEATAQSVQAQEKAVAAQKRGVELGTSTIVDLLDAQRRLLRARTDQSKARHDFISSLTGLRFQAGTLTDTDMEELNSWLASGAGQGR